jgi:hypothetical protein
VLQDVLVAGWSRGLLLAVYWSRALLYLFLSEHWEPFHTRLREWGGLAGQMLRRPRARARRVAEGANRAGGGGGRSGKPLGTSRRRGGGRRLLCARTRARPGQAGGTRTVFATLRHILPHVAHPPTRPARLSHWRARGAEGASANEAARAGERRARRRRRRARPLINRPRACPGPAGAPPALPADARTPHGSALDGRFGGQGDRRARGGSGGRGGGRGGGGGAPAGVPIGEDGDASRSAADRAPLTDPSDDRSPDGHQSSTRMGLSGAERRRRRDAA